MVITMTIWDVFGLIIVAILILLALIGLVYVGIVMVYDAIVEFRKRKKQKKVEDKYLTSI